MSSPQKHKMEFIKKIVIWAINVTTIFLMIGTYGWYIHNIEPPESLVNMVGLLITGVIVSYAGKSGVENYQKIKNSNGQNSEES